MSDLLLDTSRFKLFTKEFTVSNMSPQYSSSAKSAIVSQYNHLLDLQYTKLQASKALGELHCVHHSTIRKWCNTPKYMLGNKVFLKSSYPLNQDTTVLTHSEELNSIKPSYIIFQKEIEPETTLDKLVNVILKLKSITLTLKFN